jgi:hypothetical protein
MSYSLLGKYLRVSTYYPVCFCHEALTQSGSSFTGMKHCLIV